MAKRQIHISGSQLCQLVEQSLRGVFSANKPTSERLKTHRQNVVAENKELVHRITENVIKRINESYEQTVTITMDDYIKLLNARRAEIEPRGFHSKGTGQLCADFPRRKIYHLRLVAYSKDKAF